MLYSGNGRTLPIACSGRIVNSLLKRVVGNDRRISAAGVTSVGGVLGSHFLRDVKTIA